MPTAPTARPGPWLSALTAALCLALGAPAAVAAPEVLPYDGVLYLDGQPVNQPVNMRFSLYGAAEGGDALWTETWDPTTAPVDVKGGRFHAKLGSFESITPRILDAGTLWVGVEVMNAANAWRSLGGRQRLKKVPYAAKTLGGGDQCGDLQCNEDSVSTRFVVEGDLTAGSLTAQGALVQTARITGADASQAQALGVDGGGATEIGTVTLTGDRVLNANAINANTLTGTDYTTDDMILSPEADRAVTGGLNLTINGAVRLARLAEDGVDFMRIVGDALVFNPEQAAPRLQINTSTFQVGSAGNAVSGTHAGTLTMNGPVGANTVDVATLTAGDPDSAAVEEAAELSGLSADQLAITGCRLCFQITGRGGNVYACVKLVPGESSPAIAPRASLNSNTVMSVGLLCDGGDSAAERGTVL